MSDEKKGLEKWIAEIGVSDAPVPRAGIKTALDFFHRQMPESSRSLRLAFLKAMDLSKPVRAITLYPPFMVAAFRLCNEDPFKLFYTKAGTGVGQLAINPTNRAFQRYRVARLVPVLESRCAPALDTWTNDRRYYLGGGGGIQYIIPGSFRVLELVP